MTYQDAEGWNFLTLNNMNLTPPPWDALCFFYRFISFSLISLCFQTTSVVDKGERGNLRNRLHGHGRVREVVEYDMKYVI